MLFLIFVSFDFTRFSWSYSLNKEISQVQRIGEFPIGGKDENADIGIRSFFGQFKILKKPKP